MEFKGLYACCLHDLFIVDIGTEWNLKHDTPLFPEGDKLVDIGTEWNLKEGDEVPLSKATVVDIGTEWNLKLIYTSEQFMHPNVDIGTEWNLKILDRISKGISVIGRYRNRVEFKGHA